MSSNIKRVDVANVYLWGKHVGAVAWDNDRQFATFEYTVEFVHDGYDVSPIVLPRRQGLYSFPSLNKNTFHGLPGLLSDSLPDRFGNKLIDLWLARQGRPLDSFSPVERLCYIGSRGMGALEFKPTLTRSKNTPEPIEISKLTELAQQIVDNRSELSTNLSKNKEAIATIIKVGTSAGGARPKALIAWNRETNEVRSGQLTPDPGFESWLLKFDGINDKTLSETGGFGCIEYAYHLMAINAGIDMTECRLFRENDRAHFMTKRFDRDGNNKIHVQSLCAIAHYDFNDPGAYGYEQVFSVIQKLNLGYPSLSQMFTRMVFNIAARNQDDHTRNIDFLMGQDGTWKLSPAFDVMWAYNPDGPWTNVHQLSLRGKRDGFDNNDFLEVAKEFGIKNAKEIINQVFEAVKRWKTFAEKAGVAEDQINYIASTHRIKY